MSTVKAEPLKPFKLLKTTFHYVPSWENDDHSHALVAFKESCKEILNRHPRSRFGPIQESKYAVNWQRLCVTALHLNLGTNKEAKMFFEHWFDPYYVKSTEPTTGLFTGYYIPLLHGRLARSKEYNIPIYAMPQELSRREKGIPYHDRQSINEGAITNKAKVLAWSNNLIDVFFAQIQGSALLQLPKKKVIIGYAGHNGHKYTPIGRVLADKNALDRESITMQAIREWLQKHPSEVHSVLNQNASYVFFRFLDKESPLGTETVPLTPKRSLAVDLKYLPLGAPIWLDTMIPSLKQKGKLEPFRRLMVAQDTGGAIKGVVRGDVYWGPGEKAAILAGNMRSPGQYWILLPKN